MVSAAGSDRLILGACLVMTMGMSLTLLIFTFRLPHYGSAMESSHTSASNSFCDGVSVQYVRPFRFSLSKYGPFSCPWPPENTIFRSILAILGLLLSGLSAYLVHVNECLWLRRSSLLYALFATCWLSLATLDADSLRSGDSLCRNKFKVKGTGGDSYRLLVVSGSDLSCEPGPFVWLTIADFATVLVFAAASYAWWTFATASLQGPTTSSLQDPFLATVGPREPVNYEEVGDANAAQSPRPGDSPMV